MKIIIEKVGNSVIVEYGDAQVLFDNMNDAQEFAIKMLQSMGKLGY